MADAAKNSTATEQAPGVPIETQKPAPTNHQLIDLKEMLEAGCHFGHQARRWNPKMAKYIYTKRDGVHILDLTKTAAQLELAMRTVEEWVKNGKEIVFVGTKRQAREIVLEEANQAGAPFIVERWLGGTLTNWEQMQGRINRLVDLKAKREAGDLKQYTKRERGLIDREIERLERFFGGIAGLKKKPEALFIIDTHKEKTAEYEARISGVKVIAMMDTNCNPEDVELMGGVVIPINDDAVRSIKLAVHAIAEAYKAGKAARK
jgi:small subunit ribosomal protein S2